MSQPRTVQGPLTTEQWNFVVGALPEAKLLARAMVRRCRGFTADELETLLQDGLMRRVRDYDPSRGATLMQFTRKLLALDLVRAARTRARDPIVTAGFEAAAIHIETLSHPDLAVQFAEGVEEKEARAQRIADEMIAAAYYGYEQARSAQSHEVDVVARERWDELKRVADGAGQNVATLMDLLYAEDATWSVVADKLGVSVATAKRLEAVVIERLRAFLARELG